MRSKLAILAAVAVTALSVLAPSASTNPLSEAAKCRPKTAYAYRVFRNVAGVELWRYTLQVSWCWRNGRITYFRKTIVVQLGSVTPFLEWKPWEFKGHVGSGDDRGRYSRTVWYQGNFQVCLAEVLFCHNETPYVSLTVRGDGSKTGVTRG